MAAGLPGPALGLRLLALAVVAGSGVFLPAAFPARVSLITGIVAGALLGFAQYLVTRRRVPVPGELFVLSQVAVWTYLAHVSGGQHSALFVGYLIEIPLSAALLSRRGCWLAAVAGAGAYLASSAVLHPPLDRSSAAVAIGFLAVTALLSWLLIDLLERQQRQLAASHAALNARAENLAEELRLLGDYLNGALLGLDDMGRVVSVNQAGLELLGIGNAEALGRPWQEVLRPDPEGARGITSTLVEGRPQRGLRLLLERPGGGTIAVDGELWAGPSAEGRRTYLLLGPAQADQGDADPLRRLGEAVACVSHQIKNSLHALQGFARGIERELEGDERRSEPTQHFISALESLGELANDVLAMSGAPRAPGEVVPLHEVISSAVVLARHPRASVQVAAPARELYVRAHRGQLVHALFNLLDNACRVSPPGQVVRVHALQSGERVSVEIRDEGPGMPAHLEDVNGRAPSRNGSGYGLLAARRFLEANGGGLSFERVPEGGTLCRVTLVAAGPPVSKDREV